MISFPHAKINLGLSVVSKRSDGFHNLETIFFPLPFRDIIEIVPSSEFRLICSGRAIPGKPEDNLVWRAYEQLKLRYPRVAPLDVYLHKAIPLGAGLGGGSSDAARLLSMLNLYFHLNISGDELFAMALDLGSDCPFFLQASPCFATGRGEILEPLDLDLSGFTIILVLPEIRVETAWAFSQIRPHEPVTDLRNRIREPLSSWKEWIRNDFEEPVFRAYPVIKEIKSKLYDYGAIYASLTGSGSAVFGIFDKPVPEIHFSGARQITFNIPRQQSA